MRCAIEKYFADSGIEYFAALAYSDCREISPEIMARESFSPKSVILFLLPYYVSEGKNISAYATSLDYHTAIKAVCDGLAEVIRKYLPGAKMRGYGDHSPIDEIHAAAISGLGIIGDNTLLINERYGSYVFVGDVVTDIDPSLLGARPVGEPERCIRCGACRRACPTGILRGECRVCLSAITQKKGELSPWEEGLVRECNTAWGCDLCQRCCPYNRAPAQTPLDFFREDRITELTEGVLAEMDKATLRARAFGWRGRRVLERNLALLAEKQK